MSMKGHILNGKEVKIRPGTIKRIVNVELAEPRNRNNFEFLSIRKEIFNEFFAEQQIDLDYVI